MKRVIVCGGRDFTSVGRLSVTLTQLGFDLGDFMVIHGDAPGADRMAGQWARVAGVPEVRVPAQWDTHGAAAGPIRNAWMLNLQPDLVVAFPGGRGTADMVRQAKAAGVEVREVAA